MCNMFIIIQSNRDYTVSIIREKKSREKRITTISF